MDSDGLLFWFEELEDTHNDIVGKKCANLGQMTRLGLKVPPGFALSIDMYRKFIGETGAAGEISRYLDGFGELKGRGIRILEEISRTIQHIIESKNMPEGVRRPIGTYYNELCANTGIPDMAVSVRSGGH